MPASYREEHELPRTAGRPRRQGLEGVALARAAAQSQQQAAVEGHGIGVHALHVAHVPAHLPHGLEEVAVHGRSAPAV